MEGPQSDSKDILNVKYHLHWQIDDVMENTVVGFSRSGELFGFLGTGRIKNDVLGIISRREYRHNRRAEVNLFVNGVASDNAWNKASYLSSKNDNILYNNLSVIETLMFSSDLRRPADHHHEITALRLLAAMELDHISELRIGQLSAWQRRMVIFATEIVAGRDLIFFEQPTLDLDATASLACVTALQRVARTGVLIAITYDFLSFREYAILDRIQLLTNSGAIYFGAGARAVSYFASFGRTPSPGASVPDFLFYLVEDLNAGFLESASLRRATAVQNSNILKQAEAYIRKSKQTSTSPAVDSEIVLRRQPNTRWHPPHSDSNGLLESIEWAMQCQCLDAEEETLFKQPIFLKQFFYCLWRAATIRFRNINRFVGLLALIGMLLPAGLVVVFWGKSNNNSVEGALSSYVLLTLLPYAIAILGVIWNEDDIEDRLVFAFERERSYYLSSYFPLAAIIGDVFVFKLIPSALACILVVLCLGREWNATSFATQMHALLLVSVVSTTMSKAVFNVLSPKLNCAIAALVSVFLLTLQLLYSGIFECLGTVRVGGLSDSGYLQWLLRDLSLFRWVCGVLYWSEIHEQTTNFGSQPLLDCIAAESPNPNTAFVALWALAVFYALVSIAFSVLLHK